ncbi:MAG TPA: adenosylcobalamin-dependent ribonucleoside-diphosphate reductase [Lentisphaeria bacterium]|nr:MAG: ribonucleoside-diphosphate reductase, adenosylcobalamin-dependent [Lentisphaerae bacterium GWF2_50_93]HCE42355.1 adenosylcobalamin-dependent ribonucleoside-diphosphate reductase [Lentisphaeria bacterium]
MHFNLEKGLRKVTLKKFFDIGTEIWNRKYRYEGSNGLPEDKTIEETWKRVAKAAAAVEKNSREWEKKFNEILVDYRFLPGGRILSNAGTARDAVTMFNCYVMNKIDDSIEGIFDVVKDSAITQKQGGGVGFDFSTIRPVNSHIKGCEAKSSGPISFMQVMDSTCRTIMSAGQRRGAQMAVMRCDHPDIQDFITAKRGNSNLHMFNLSVAVTDKFINAVKKNQKWDLVFNGNVHKTLQAVELWELMMKSTYDYAEPGFVLIDRVNQMNNLYYNESICATNPCGEQPLPPYGACLLGSVNLTRFVDNPFTSKARIDFKGIEGTVRTAVRFLDNIIEISGYPLEKQKEEAMKKRRMGLGITGLADLFIFMRTRYGSSESIKMVSDIMKLITATAYDSSIELGMEKGVFPAFDKDKYPKGKFVATLPKEIQKGIARHGLRNSHLTSIAPTGTISLFAGNISSGIEPVFELTYDRKIRNTTEQDVSVVEISDYAYKLYSEQKHDGKSKLPDYFVTADMVTPEEHVKIQAELQKHVDSSISKTINIPTDYPYEKFKSIYMYACDHGLKGCTTFRPSDKMTGILTKKEDPAKKAEQKPIDVPRPKELEGTTYKIKTPLSPDALYLTINDIIEEGTGRRRPYELFINTKNLQHLSWIVAMTRLISAVFRKEPDPSFLVDELKSIYDPNGGYFSEGKYIPSLAADIGLAIEQHLTKIGMIKKKENGNGAQSVLVEKKPKKGAEKKDDRKFMICPQCNDKSLYFQENCLKCLSCGYSKCG